MFKITPVSTDTRRAEVAALCGISLHDGSFLYEMIDVASGDLLGACEFEIEGALGVLLELVDLHPKGDFEAMFILGRATMNFIDLCGAHRCTARGGAAASDLLGALGFREAEDGPLADLSGMFDGHCAVTPSGSPPYEKMTSILYKIPR